LGSQNFLALLECLPSGRPKETYLFFSIKGTVEQLVVGVQKLAFAIFVKSNFLRFS
jgi:hypothetical protein